MKENVGKVINWIKANKLTSFLLLLVLYFLLYRRPVLLPQLIGSSSRSGITASLDTGGSLMSFGESSSYEKASYSSARSDSYYPTTNVAPQPDVTDRKVITNSSMSLQVKDVRDTMDKIKNKARTAGGYVVQTSVTTPEFGEDGSIVVRVPSESLDATLEYFRGLAVKVVSENIDGTDITDEYVDIQARINRLEATKSRFEQILNDAETVDEILRVQREIFNLQDQIDSYKGRIAYMDGASSTTLIRIYLSTDELGLPYTPAQTWRPQVVFKQATRSLLLSSIKIANAAIWIAVYIPLIAGAYVLYKLVKYIFHKRKNPSQK